MFYKILPYIYASMCSYKNDKQWHISDHMYMEKLLLKYLRANGVHE